jgi:hypothetical protein
MDDTSLKTCPFCKEKIRNEAVKCRFCGEWLEQPVSSPLSQPASQEPVKNPQILPTATTTIIEQARNVNPDQNQEIAPAKVENVTKSETLSENMQPSLEDFALGEKTFRDLAESLNSVPSKEQWEAEFLAQKKTGPTIQPLVLEKLWEASKVSGNKPLPVKVENEVKWPLVPLMLILFWIFWYALPKAIENGASDVKYLTWGTFAYCTTPGSILILLLLFFWFAKNYQTYRSSKTSSNIGKKSFNLLYFLSVGGVGIIVLGSMAFFKCHSAWEQRVAKDKQDMQAKGINLDALNGWEVTKNNQRIGDAKTGLSPEIIKRMRENFALQCRGELASIEGASVELEGDSHDKLTFAFSGALTKDSSKVFVDALRQGDPDFGNRLRFLNFKELVLAGTNYSETFSQTDFLSWSQNYDAFVSNTIAMYGTTGNTNSFFSNKDEISPEMQKLLRSRLADGMNGALKSIYKSYEVKLVGTNDDVLVFSCKDASEKDMTDMLKSFQEDKNGYFFDGLNAMGISELVFEGRTYRRSIPRGEFTQWCRNYDQYMAELHKVVSQMSDAMQHNASTP